MGLPSWQTAAMALPGPTALPPSLKPTRREIVIAVLQVILRMFLGFWVIVWMLNLVPDTPDGRVIVPAMIAITSIVIYAWFFRRQLKSIDASRFPTLRAAEALVLVAAMFLAIFAMIYVMISQEHSDAFTEPLDPFTGYYFALTVLATVGFGDITPVSVTARSVTMVQMALDLVFIAVLIRVVGGAARRAVEKREHREPASPPATAVATPEGA
jgi:voltage-gated potassium channel